MTATAPIRIIPATTEHSDALWEIFHDVVSKGDAYVFEPTTPREEALAIWLDPKVHPFVAISGDRVVGTYLLKNNQPGLGSHVANASYMVAESARGKGIGAAMCRHSLRTAKALGYRAMQFNIVVATNRPAVALWLKYGFTIIGTLPGAYRHADLGYVDAHVMFRDLDDIEAADP